MNIECKQHLRDKILRMKEFTSHGDDLVAEISSSILRVTFDPLRIIIDNEILNDLEDESVTTSDVIGLLEDHLYELKPWLDDDFCPDP